MIWDEFLRHFRFCDEEDSGLSDEEQAHTKTDTSSQEKLFGEIQNSFLNDFIHRYVRKILHEHQQQSFFILPFCLDGHAYAVYHLSSHE